MPASNFLKIDAAGRFSEEAPATAGGAPDANKIPALDGNGRLTSAMLPTGIGADTLALTTSEALSAGDLVNIFNSSGAKVRKADGSTAGKEAHGFVLAAAASGATATVYFEGTNDQMTGMTPGPQYLSDTTPGKTTATPPTGSGKIVQVVGFAASATAMNFQSNPSVTRA